MAKRVRSDRGLSSRVTPADQREFIDRARKRFQQAETADTKQRSRELDDLQFYAGAQWDPLVLQAREGQPANNNANAQGLPPVPPRPAYVINKVREPVRQVLNQERQADLGVEIAAADDFGEGTPGISPEEIELREGLVRRIQRESQAADARSWAFQRAVIAGRGFYRVMTRYRPGRTNDQEIYVDRIYNQSSVSLDPNHEQPDGSDADWGFIGTDVPWDRYVTEYGKLGDTPNALVSTSQSEWRALGDELPGWFSADGDQRSVRIVEYWYAEPVDRTLVTLQDGRSFYENDEDRPADVPVGVDENDEPLSRSVTDRVIKWAKLDGVQVLEETEWPGKYIPIIKVLGEELQPFDSERRAEGMVRPSRDSQRGFNVMVSKWVEQIGLAPIPPWMGAAGFDEGFETEYALSNTRTLPALHFNTRDLEGNPIAPPTRTSITMEIQAIAGSVQLFDQAIKSTTAIPDPTLGNIDPSLKSGRAIKQVLEQATRGTSHYLDNLSRSIRYEGQIVNDLLYPIYSRQGRVVRTMNPRGETQAMMLGVPFVRHPQTQQPISAQQMAQMGQPPTTTEAPTMVKLTPDATFNVTVKVTKSFDTRREEQESVLSTLVQAEPQLMSVFGDLLFKYNDGPGHDELEARAKAMLAPPIQALLSGQKGPDPQLQQAMAENAQLKQMLQSKTAEIQAKGQIEFARDQADNAVKLEVERIRQEGQFAVASLKVQIEAVNTAIAAMQEERTSLHEAVKTDRENQLAHTTLAHEAAQNQLQRTHELVQQAVGHVQGLEQADQSQAHALEQGAQQHAAAADLQANQYAAKRRR